MTKVFLGILTVVLAGLLIYCKISCCDQLDTNQCETIKRGEIKDDEEKVRVTFSRRLDERQFIYSEPILFCESSIVDAIILSAKYDTTKNNLKFYLSETKDESMFLSIHDITKPDGYINVVLKLVKEPQNRNAIDSLHIKIKNGDKKVIRISFLEDEKLNSARYKPLTTPKVCDFYIVP